MADYRKAIETRQMEADRISAELKKAEGRVALLRQRLARKNKEVKDLLKADQEQWMKLLMEQLDSALKEKRGEHYWQNMEHEDVVGLMMREIPGNDGKKEGASIPERDDQMEARETNESEDGSETLTVLTN